MTMSTKNKTPKGLLRLRQTMAALKYVAQSPSRKWGGFHPTLVLTAKSALWHIAQLRSKK